MLRLALVIQMTLLSGLCCLPGSAHAELEDFFFLHHSVGRNIINDADLRGWFAEYDDDQNTNISFWDHDYNHIGLRDPSGELLGYHYGAAANNTDPDGLHYLWTTTTQNAARDSILNNHQIIAFKSCYTGSDITSNQQFSQYQQYYQEMLEVFDLHPDKIFVLMTSPPRNRRHAMGEASIAARARAMASWLGSEEFAGASPNLFVVDLFDLLAEPNDGQPGANTLRSEYERNSGTDSHPNTYANSIVGPVIASFLVECAALGDIQTSVTGLPAMQPRLISYPNPFNPSAIIAFHLEQPQFIDLEIFDLRGRLVASLISQEVLAPGSHQRTWNGHDRGGHLSPSGIYLCRLRTSGSTTTIKLTMFE